MRTRANGFAESWVSVEEVAGHLGVRKESVYRWIEQRGLPATKIGKLFKLKLSEVDAWMRAAASRKANGDLKRSARPLRNGASKPVVLCIDDEELVRDTLADFLGDEGFAVLLASDGAEALTLLGTAAPLPSLIILDLTMPKLDGRRFLEQQRRDPKLAGIPVIVVTATLNASVEAAAVLRKPLRLTQLADAIDSLLETHEKAKSHQTSL